MEDDKKENETKVDNQKVNNKNDKNYLEFKTQSEFNEYLNKYTSDYEDKITLLEKENKELKVKDIEIKKLNKQIETFTNHIFEKYNVKDIKLDNSKFDYSNYENLEKSIIKTLENQKINYKKSIDDQEKNNKKEEIPKIYL